jgi:hypothetical protein
VILQDAAISVEKRRAVEGDHALVHQDGNLPGAAQLVALTQVLRVPWFVAVKLDP